MTCSRVIVTTTSKPVTAGVKIFKQLFRVEMTAVDATDERDISRRGAFTTGDSTIDRQLALRPVSVYRTIDQLVDGYLSGIEFTLFNGLKDAEKISNIIQEHLADCEHYHRFVLTGLYQENPKDTQQRLQELKQLDEFGRYIYNKVRRFGKLQKYNPFEKSKKDFSPLLGSNPSAPAGGQVADYVPIEERIDYSGLRTRRRIR